ncbi:hypothetical protein PAXRUDRAFT_631085 [Paxillus rubicundulus Ve08.2h10]|uniref:Uncharacterized protein n=1 Tax=Paxillus rubicundulus Ve08.2h10 TaxID=930991 RepID=A0A0D0BM29_9AGAM|nr:hypothetical protein PAXRUDRAFT_631085 [Paxillus rubicundulus Ve08.2h10]
MRMFFSDIPQGSHSIVGYWRVSHNEPDCNTYWRSREDQGCASPALRALSRASKWR